MSETKSKIGRHIKDLRESKLHLTQAGFADILLLDRTYLSRVESGKQNITIDTLEKICDKLDVGIDEFFEGIN